MTSDHLQVGLHETEDSVATSTTVQLQFGSLIPACVNYRTCSNRNESNLMENEKIDD